MRCEATGRRRVIVTRPANDAGEWVQHLQCQGFAAEALPLIDIAAAAKAADVQAVTQAWQNIGNYAACMFVSGNAVRFFFENKQAPRLDLRYFNAIDNIANKHLLHTPSTLRFMAPGPGTATALLAAGVPSGQIDAPPLDANQFDSEALWAVVGQRSWQGCRVLVVRGVTLQHALTRDISDTRDVGGLTDTHAASSGRDWITRQWQAAGCEVDFLGVYERRAPVWTAAQLERARAASADGSVWLFSSSEALHHLIHMPGLAGVDWRRAVAITTHKRITATVLGAGWGVVAESRPTLVDVFNCLHSIESSHS